ncbi:putative DNA-binding domain-containing protein [Stenotrophomonas sp. SY1]|uniref:HvfC family RiPP maturation protein n=1 Tax=Stenotrophomonas sp. SY1 TaxID=477235 RepID=UPI001E30C443|nr:putative DNA-binding domain-containing protein [Stenotrophomonas sp. SY1]MCD9086435.1 putative DNA-binding domain-containing protein [Stenotrophomonas sp. SY1]
MAESLQQLQMRFAAHLRDPDRQPAPSGMADERMQVYRELYFNNIQSLLAANFPVIRRTLGQARWLELVRAFCREHRAHTPLFTEIGQEFIHFLDSHAVQADETWLLELAHYEWIELALQLADDPLPAHDPAGDLLDGMPVLSPWCRALAYHWPVHRIGPEYQPAQPLEPTLLLARRQSDGSIAFSELSPLLYRLLERLEQHPDLSGRQQLQALATEAGVAPDADFLANGALMLDQLRTRGCLIGAAPQR